MARYWGMLLNICLQREEVGGQKSYETLCVFCARSLLHATRAEMGAAASGAAASTDDDEARSYRVSLHPGTPHADLEAIIEDCKLAGGSVGLITWPEPVSFHGSLPTRQAQKLREVRGVLAVEDEDSVTYHDGDPDGYDWQYWLCGTARKQGAPPASWDAVEVGPPDSSSKPASLHKSSGGPSVACDRNSSIPAARGVAPSSTNSRSSPDATERLRLGELFRHMAPTVVDEFTALRFLRAKRGDPIGAAAMYRAHLAWRTDERVDQILHEELLTPPQQVAVTEVFRVRVLDGLDDKQRPVLYFAPHDLDLRALEALGISAKTLLRTYFQAMEQALAALSRAPSPYRGLLSIVDVSAMSVGHTLATLSFWIQLGKALEANYPETLDALCVLGAPAGTAWVLSSVETLIAPAVAGKLSFPTGEPSDALVAMLPSSLVPRDLLPPDPHTGKCSSAVV